MQRVAWQQSGKGTGTREEDGRAGGSSPMVGSRGSRALVLLLALAGTAAIWTGCDDDSGPSADGGHDAALDAKADGAKKDGAKKDGVKQDGVKQDGNGDSQGADGKKDISSTDSAGDSAADASSDGKGHDGASDSSASDSKAKPDLGTPILEGYVTRSVTPVNDGKGTLHILLQKPSFPFPINVASVDIKHADLSKPGAKVKYTLHSTTTSGKALLSAWMDDNNNIWLPFPMAQEGDLVMSKAVSVTLGGPGKTVKQNLVLDKLQSGAATDGGPSFGGVIKGKIRAKVAPSGDGKGNVIVALMKPGTPPTLYGQPTFLIDADLSSPFTSEAYYFSGVMPGQYLLSVFLDDNSNASFITPVPDKGDMVLSKKVAVHVSASSVTVQDLLLDAIKK